MSGVPGLALLCCSQAGGSRHVLTKICRFVGACQPGEPVQSLTDVCSHFPAGAVLNGSKAESFITQMCPDM